VIAAFEDGRGHGLSEWAAYRTGKGQKIDSPLELPEECNLVDNLILAQLNF
jgi:hypothetical protein